MANTQSTRKESTQAPTQSGYYWLIRSGLRQEIVLVRDDRFYTFGRMLSHKLSSIKSEHEWYGPIVFGK